MDELRWALLGVGVLFLSGLAWWELRKPRHAANDGEADSGSTGTLRTPAATHDFGSPAVRRVEPHFGDPPATREIPDDVPTVHPLEPEATPPVILVDDFRSMEHAHGIAVTSDVAIDTPTPASRSLDLDEPLDEAVPEPEPELEPEPVQLADEAPAAATPRPPPEPEWPPEGERRILSLRVVPRPPNRFSGRPLRQALLACGLDYGAMDIFHLEDEHGSVFASAANLMRPGTFNLDTMDGSHFHGVNLFCVLPGPLPPGRAADELVALARDLGQRLGGIVLDEVGQPLDEQAAARLRASVTDGPEG